MLKVLRCIVLSVSCHGGMWHGCSTELESLVCSCSSVSCTAPLGCAVLHREPRSASVSLGLRPHSHLGHREKECADLMMYRKSVEPHSDPSAAIGRHCAPKAQPTLNSSPVQKACGNPVCGPTRYPFARGHVLCCYTPGCSTFSVTSAEVGEVSARQDREQKG